MDRKAFNFNCDAKYRTGGNYSSKVGTEQLVRSTIQVLADSVNRESNRREATSFEANFPDVFQKYLLPYVKSDQLVQAWNSHPMQFWQNQLNFAVWCATTGCGVSSEDHLAASDPLMKALYTFHAYYQIRRILAEIQAPLPQDRAWNAFNNPYDRRSYERICSEYEVPPHTDWHCKGQNHGMGRVYNYWTHVGYHLVGNGEYHSDRMSFTEETTNEVLHVDYISQDTADASWATFILDKSQGFTHPGVERLNDSIRTYVWAILGSQAQTRTGILGTGTAFDAQKQYLANIEDAVSSPVDLPSAIKRYQDVLQYAGSEVNFVFGIGLYMAPSDMLLRIGQIAGYNNEIVIATSNQALGVNKGINVANAPPNASVDTGETGLVKPQESPPSSKRPRVDKQTRSFAATQKVGADQHNGEKTALIVGGIGVGLVVLWLFR